MKRVVLMILATFLTFGVANAQLKLGDKLKKGLNALTEEVEKTSSKNQQSTPTPPQKPAQTAPVQQPAAVSSTPSEGFDEFSASNIPANALYVTIDRGSARGTGTKDSPLKDIQRAIDLAPNGGVVCVAEGNYLGNLDRGWMEIKGKYVSIIGGFNADFTDRDPQKYVTRIQPTVQQRGTIGMGLLMLECTSNMAASMVIDGISFDLPEDMVQGVYEIWLEQDGFSWLLDDSFEVLAVAVEKRLKAVRYYAPYIGASKIMTEWSISLDDPVSLTFSEYLVEGDELSLNAYDRYVCGEDGTFVLDYDGRKSSNDIEITYTRDSEGKVTGSDVLRYGKKEATPFVWTYGTDGLLTDVSSPVLVYKTFEYEDGKMTGFGQVSFVYGDASLTNSPLAPDVIWGYMSVQDPDNPFLCFPYLLGWYSGTSVLLPEKIVMPSVTGTGTVTYEMSYEFDAEGYVVSMSWNEGGSEHWVEYLY